MKHRLREWVNNNIAVPIVLLLRGWVLNKVIANLPVPWLRNVYYRSVCGISVHSKSWLGMGAQFTGGALNKIQICEGCSIGFESFWVAGAAITIRRGVVIGHRVEFYTSDHDPDDPLFSRRDAPIVVEDFAWIGSRAIILKGVTIGRGAVVAAASLIAKDVEPYTIVGGNPARIIRSRGTRNFEYRISGPPMFG